jgi:hypothetical protein
LPPKLPGKKLSISFFLLAGATPMHPKNGFNATRKFFKRGYALSATEPTPFSMSKSHFTSRARLGERLMALR